MRWRDGVFYNYEGYFGKPRKHAEIDENKKGWEPEFDIKKWQWLLMVDKLCERHNKTPEEVYETNYIDCLNWLSMYNEKEKYIRSVEKQNKR